MAAADSYRTSRSILGAHLMKTARTRFARGPRRRDTPTRVFVILCSCFRFHAVELRARGVAAWSGHLRAVSSERVPHQKPPVEWMVRMRSRQRAAVVYAGWWGLHRIIGYDVPSMIAARIVRVVW